jgi:hypothetical protein
MLYGNNVRISKEKIEEESQPYLVLEEKQSFELICLNTQESVVPKRSLAWREGLFQIFPICLYFRK